MVQCRPIRGERRLTEKVVILVGPPENLDEVLEVVDRRMAFLDSGMQDRCQAFVLFHETRPREVVCLLICRCLHKATLLQDIPGRCLFHQGMQHGSDVLHSLHASRDHLGGMVVGP